MARKPRAPRYQSCNVVADVGGRTRLWLFQGSDGKTAGTLECASDVGLPAKAVAKGWGQLARPRLNIAWLGEQPIFLQVVNLPTDDPAEVPAMLELQMEKLSPLPVGQIVWSHEILPDRPATGLMVMVAMVERNGVESMLAGLERRGYFADRLESPLIPLVTGMKWVGDGAYLFVFRWGARSVCLVGWVTGGALRALNVVNLSGDDRWRKQLTAEFSRMAWAGDLEGWTGDARAVHLVADEATLLEWRGVLEAELGVTITPHVRAADGELAGASVRRATVAGGGTVNLLPPERSARYRQQYTDRLWMGGLLALFGAYVVGVLIYLGAVEVLRYRQGRLADQVAVTNSAYTNTLRLKAQVQVLQETVNLRFAALDCWLATVEAMPEELSLDSLAFSGGQSVVISGTAPGDQEPRIVEFWQSLQRKVVGNTNLFSEVTRRPTVTRNVAGGVQIQWSFVCRLQRGEI